MVNIETCYLKNLSAVNTLDSFDAKFGKIAHFNQYLYINISQETSKSSTERMITFKQINPSSNHQILEFLGSTKNKDYPVYRYFFLKTKLTIQINFYLKIKNRTGNKDGVYTLATQFLDFENNTVSIWYQSNPFLSDPDLKFPIY